MIWFAHEMPNGACIVEDNGHGPLVCHLLTTLEAFLDIFARLLMITLKQGSFSRVIEGQGYATTPEGDRASDLDAQ